eukprot:TRINITY_DN4324_c0_g1_i1.p1 TRINITY_DN4324_c0_g1~~TRINITY_DN4324_c0_g1_i1.p1  ORF type:complete len:385 (+),score=185.13 TRINITY_DN4324_c0_g1_i1:45-1157(+)
MSFGGALAREATIALNAVAKASVLCSYIQKRLDEESVQTKSDLSPVTIADYASQALISSIILSHLSDHPIVGEESGKKLLKNPGLTEKVLGFTRELIPELTAAASEEEAKQKLADVIEQASWKSSASDLPRRWWTLDPIDGTLGFLRKGQYAVALALMEDNQPIMGLLGCPELPESFDVEGGNKGSVLIAVKGQGAYSFELENIKEGNFEAIDIDALHGKKLQVNSSTDLSQIRLVESFERHDTEGVVDIVRRRLNIAQEPLRIDSQCKYSTVARGDSSLYLRVSSLTYKEKIWDHAGGHIIVEESGGLVTDALGRPLDYSRGHALTENFGILCASPALHEIVLNEIKALDPVAFLTQQQLQKAQAQATL